ncbi:Vibriobactin utilization protein ViuB [Pseudooceanicola marinus]|uniref:Vibriobactin utilization protein ViuB n=1 Tax=Pseudooceanicola marinus TaxID=396013 RepID=A0A1X6YM50_9RHOB|nr:siderophore-interacting protein [Pseudooceanicola marinus]PJE29394.1 siderophore-interacting protein [Pseudooceanicola marinus]SLN25372.1 Vibriobactin utilization protein ViuB [Pseudooceanicola marinus]
MIHVETDLKVPAQALRKVIRAQAQEWDMAFTETEDWLRVQMIGGVLSVSGQGRAARMRVESDTASDLQALRDYLTGELVERGLRPQWEGERPQTRPANQSLARVARVARISPSFRRVTLAGHELARFDEAQGFHFRLLFGPEGAGWPGVDDIGVTVWPGGAAAWHRPVYTVRKLWTEGGVPHLDFDIVLHEGGTVTEWSAQLAPGSEVILAGPGGDQGRRAEGWQLFMGDATAVPVIARLLALLPEETRGRAVLFVPDADDRQPLDHPAGVEVQWVVGDTPDFATTLAGAEMPAEDRFVFAAGPRAAIGRLREGLAEVGLGKREVYAAAYW